MAGWKDRHRRRRGWLPRKQRRGQPRRKHRTFSVRELQQSIAESRRRIAEIEVRRLEEQFTMTPELLERRARISREMERDARWEREAQEREHVDALQMDAEWERTSSPPARRRRRRRRILGSLVAAMLFAAWWVAVEAKHDACLAGSACARHNLQEEKQLERKYGEVWSDGR
jgi:hypothetical protein